MRKITLAILALALTTLACATPQAIPVIERETIIAGEFAWSRAIERAVENSSASERRAIRQTVVIFGAAVLISAIPVPSPDDVPWLTLAGMAVAP